MAAPRRMSETSSSAETRVTGSSAMAFDRGELQSLQRAHHVVPTTAEEVVQPQVLAVERLVGGMTHGIGHELLLARACHTLGRLDDRAVGARRNRPEHRRAE